MSRRAVAATALALLVLTAGCSFLGGGSTTPGANATATPTATATPAAFTYPEGYAASGVTDGEAAADTHREAVLSLDSFTVTYDATISTPNETIDVDYDQTSDLADERALLRFNLSSGERFYGGSSQYYTADTVYVRSTPSPNRTTYSNASRSFNASMLTASEFVDPLLTDVRYGEATVVRRDGESMARYEATGLERADRVFGKDVTAENVSAFSATLFVDADGVVRRVEYSATVTRGESTREIEATVVVTALDDTSVDRPAWVDRA